MSLAPLLHLVPPASGVVSQVGYSAEHGLVVALRQQWTITNLAAEPVAINGHPLPLCVAHPIIPFDLLTIGHVAYRFVPVVQGIGPNV